MAARGEGFSACNHGLLPEIAKLQNHQILQEIALRALDDPDPQIVSSAAAYLMEYGTPSAEDVLWARFTAWSERWQGREDELQYVPGTRLDGTYECGAGSNLMQARAAGQGWLADETKLRRLIDLSVGPQQRHQAEQYLATWRARPLVHSVHSLRSGAISNRAVSRNLASGCRRQAPAVSSRKHLPMVRRRRNGRRRKRFSRNLPVCK